MDHVMIRKIIFSKPVIFRFESVIIYMGKISLPDGIIVLLF